MQKNFRTLRNYWIAVQFVMMITWASHLIYTDCYYSVYALCAALAVFCLADNWHHDRSMGGLPLTLNLVISSLLSLATALGNYPIFQRIRNENMNMYAVSPGTNTIINIFEAVLTFVCGIIVFYHIFQCLASRFPAILEEGSDRVSGEKPCRVFVGSLLFFLAIYLIYLFFVVYPGSVTSDSIDQINRIVTGKYTNHHPHWHTMCIKLFMELGYTLFGDTNAAAATFCAFQALAMAATFAYTVMTLYQYRLPRLWVILPSCAFAFLPNHITYSTTMWKDVPFGLCVLVLVVSMFRIFRNIGSSQKMNFAMLFVGGIGTSIMRSNGWYAMVAAFLVLALFFHKRCKNMILPWIIILVIGWALTNPILTMLKVEKVNFIEGLSVPLQQVARVITEGGDLTQEEEALLANIVDLEDIPLIYTPECCDPIKDEIRSKNYPYLQEHKSEFMKLWLQIGARYPWEYVEAWVEETKGYWNGGYDYYIYAQYVSENSYGMYMVEQTNLIHDLVKMYFTVTRETVFFEPIQSIGFNVWILSMLCFFNLLHGRKEFLLTVPVLAVVFTLWLTTPVYSEFRYAYCVFTTLPFILPVSLYAQAGEEK